MWPWERKAYEQGFNAGTSHGRVHTLAEAGRMEAAARAEAEAEAAIREDDLYRKLGRLLWEARRELADDHPLHARIREALDKGGEPDNALARIEAMFPGTVTRR